MKLVYSRWLASHSEASKNDSRLCVDLDDAAGLEMLHHMNIDHVTWECDYPHSDTVWPNVPEYLWASVNALPRETIDKITHLNALREYGFDPFTAMGGRDNCTVGALRVLGKDVDVSPRVGLGGLKTDSMDTVGKARRPVTSGEIMRMFAAA